MILTEIPTPDLIGQMESPVASVRDSAARELFRRGRQAGEHGIAEWRADPQIRGLITEHTTIGIAVARARFAKIRAGLGNPPLATVPPDQDAQEFEWELDQRVHLDILTTKEPNGQGTIAKFLAKFGEGIQQVEFLTDDIDRGTSLLQSRLGVKAIYPATRAGANGTRVNFFLARVADDRKILIELVEARR